MRVSILTLFPEMFQGPFEHSIIKKAQESHLIFIEYINIRDFGLGKHKVVDDKPYGGGTGMVLRVDVIAKAIEATKKRTTKTKQKVILLDARGQTFTQKKAIEYAKLNHLIMVAGHYEGFDERIKSLVDESISVGDYILTGGEIPVMVLTDAVTRLIPQVLKIDATKFESFSKAAFTSSSCILEHPHYTRPKIYKQQKVPSILLSGNHKEIEKWRKDQALSITKKQRPDLIKK